VGRYLRISQGNNDSTVAVIQNIRGVLSAEAEDKLSWQFHIECHAIGTLIDGKTFERGSVLLPVPTELAFPAGKATMEALFAECTDFHFPIGKLSVNKDIDIKLHGDRFFSKHIA